MKAKFLKRGPLLILGAAIIVTTAHALIDADTDGMSDVWEQQHGFSITSGSLPAHQAPTADADGDGWTNLEESQAGTDPNSGTPPLGILKPTVLKHPDFSTVFTISWPSIEGKQYTLFASPDLSAGSWIQIDNPVMGTGATIEYGTEALDEDGYLPERLFWKVTVTDVDSDGDTLYDWEELATNLNPFSIDTDLDGLPDNTDPLPRQSATLADPDGMGIANAVANTDMVGWWDFQASGTGFVPMQYASRFAPQYHTLQHYSGSQAFHCFSDKGIANTANVSSRAHLEVFGNSPNLRNSTAFTLNYWIKLPENELDTGVASGQAHEYGSGGTTYAPATQRVITLGSYDNSADHNPSLEWRAVRAPSGGTRFQLREYSGSVLYNIIATGAWDTSSKIDDGRWHHVALRVSSNTIRTFLDGLQVGNPVTHTFIIPTNANTTGAWLLVGGTKRVPINGTTATSYPDFRGKIDSIMVHRRGLTNAEVEGLYKRDRDADQLWDITEVKTSLWRDNDSNGNESTSELSYLSSPFQWQPANTDTDDDEATDLEEQAAGTEIGNPDTDGDLIPDGWEIRNGLNPKQNNLSDSDGDGLSDLDEYRYDSNPLSPHSDNDGVPDGTEHTNGSHPADGSDGGQPIPLAERLSIKLGVGDRSGSESEDYVLNVFTIDPQTGNEKRFFTLRSGGYGQYTESTKSFFRKGSTYFFQIDWQGTNGQIKAATQQSGAEGPDFDYHMVVEPQGSINGIIVDSLNTNTWEVDTNKAILDPQDVSPSDDDDDNVLDFLTRVEKSRVVLLALDVNSDLNNDGVIDNVDKLSKIAASDPEADQITIEKGTEYAFINNRTSNGKGDRQDSTSSVTTDDDGEKIDFHFDANFGKLHFNHPAIEKMDFFYDAECKTKVTFPIDFTAEQMPHSLYLRPKESGWTGEVAGELVVMFTPQEGGEEYEMGRIKLTIVESFGNTHFFHATRDYISERNTELYIHDNIFEGLAGAPDVTVRICVMREEATDMRPYELYEPAYDNWVASGGTNPFSAYTYRETAGISEVMLLDQSMTVVINGNQCGFSSGMTSAEAAALGLLGDPQITDKCQGRIQESGKTQSSVSSDHYDENTNAPGTNMKGSPLAGPDPIPGTSPAQPGGKHIAQYSDGSFAVGAGYANAYSGSPPSLMLSQIGGLSSSYALSDRNNYNNSIVGFAPVTEEGKGVVFVAMGKDGDIGKGRTVEFYNAAISSGVPTISGATTPSGTLPPIQAVFLDSGVTSCALAHKDPDDNLSLVYKGSKHNGIPYYTNTFLRFKSTKPRP